MTTKEKLIKEYGKSENDTGSTEVQVALAFKESWQLITSSWK